MNPDCRSSRSLQLGSSSLTVSAKTRGTILATNTAQDARKAIVSIEAASGHYGRRILVHTNCGIDLSKRYVGGQESDSSEKSEEE